MATRRPDLEAMPAARPGYIATRICPFLPVQGKAGTLYYRDIETDLSAQTNRSAGAAPTTSTVDEASTTLSLGEKIRRANIDDAARELYGSLANAERILSRLVKRSVMEVIEELVSAAVLVQENAHEIADIMGTPLAAIDTAVQAIEDYGADGQICIVGSKRVVNRLKRYADVIDRMKFTGVLPGRSRDVRSVSDSQLAAALDVDLILPGNNRHWYTQSSDYQDRIAVMVLPNPDPEVQPVEEIQFGRSCVFPVNDQDGVILLETYHDDNLAADVVQARSWIDVEVINPELVYILNGIDEENAVTTSTTTT